MASNLTWKALDLYSDYYDRWFPLPLQWDKKRQAYRFNTNQRQNITRSILSILLLGSSSGLCLFLIFRPVFTTAKALPIFNQIILLLASFLCSYGIGTVFLVFTLGSDAAAAFNSTKKLSDELMPIDKKGRKKLLIKRAKPDLIGTGLFLQNAGFIAAPFLFVVLALFLHLDPYYYIIQELISPGIVRQFAHIGRLILIFIMGTEGCRMGPLLISWSIIWLILMHDVLGIILSSENKHDGWLFQIQMRGIQIYKQLEVTKAHMDRLGKFILFLGILVLLFCLTMSNYITVTCYYILPFVIYIGAPFSSVALFLLVQFAFPANTFVFTMSKSALFKFSQSIALIGHPKMKRILRTTLASIRPIRLNVGINDTNLFFMNESTKVEFYNVVIDYSISAVLSYPADRLKPLILAASI